jgi:F-type H+-transporting ATPase subunit alpha
VEILKQNLSTPFKVEDQVAIIFAGSRNLLRKVPIDKVKEFESHYLEMLNAKHRDMLDELKSGKLTDQAIETMTKVAAEIADTF